MVTIPNTFSSSVKEYKIFLSKMQEREREREREREKNLCFKESLDGPRQKYLGSWSETVLRQSSCRDLAKIRVSGLIYQ